MANLKNANIRLTKSKDKIFRKAEERKVILKLGGMHGAHVVDVKTESSPLVDQKAGPPRRLFSCGLAIFGPGVLCALADTDAFGRALSTVGHLLAPKDDEAFAVALSLDAPATLSALKGRAEKLGHTALLEKVQDLLSI